MLLPTPMPPVSAAMSPPPSAEALSSALLAFRIGVPPWLRMPPALAEVWCNVVPFIKSVNMLNLFYWLP